MRSLTLALTLTLLFFQSPTLAADTVKVFVLAGQSNMEGKATNALYDHQATAEKTKHLFKHLRKDGKWIVRDDVFIKFLKRSGPLTLGYGSPKRTGVELEFGRVVGDHFKEPVILVKAAWGGHSLYKLFRPPSSGMPNADYLSKKLEDAVKRTKNQNKKRNQNKPLPTMADIKAPFGISYRNMMAEVDHVMKNHAKLFPATKGKKLEIAGFVWFQGWNDMYDIGPNEYEVNMKNLIKDIRKDWKKPNLPVVIAAMGQNQSKPAKGNMQKVKDAQFAMNNVPEFKGNVKTIPTDVLVDKAAEKLYPHWRKNFEEWKRTGSDFGYHYMGSAIWFNRIGESMGKTMLKLIANKKGT